MIGPLLPEYKVTPCDLHVLISNISKKCLIFQFKQILVLFLSVGGGEEVRATSRKVQSTTIGLLKFKFLSG